MSFPRVAGILLHPTSLASRGGIGDFGPAAYRFVDFLASARQGLWQVLPLGPIGYGNSPYSSTSAFAGNPLLISLERLAEHGWIDLGKLGSAKLTGLEPGCGPVEYDQVFARKMPLLFEAARNFLGTASSEVRRRMEEFRQKNAWWLDDFVLFDALRARHKLACWNQWPHDLAYREPSALTAARKELAADIQVRGALQFAFYEQWRALRRYCAERAIRIVGDVAIFMNHDSADVWVHRELFRLDEKLEPEVVAGVPPDSFSETGQRWGTPLYRWDALKASGYEWWIQRLRWATQNFDYVRLDHFRGFDQFWEIPASETTAINGRWVDGPRDDFFLKLREALGGLPFFAEDLGYITPAVHALRDRLQIPGMAVLQFAFGDEGAHIYLPHRAAEKVMYTGTHDNDTVVGWWLSGAAEHERRNAEAYLGPSHDGIHWGFIRGAQCSPAALSIVPLQDVLGLGSEARMNTPSLHLGNWRWRFDPGRLSSELTAKLALLAEVTDRLPRPFAGSADDSFAA
ncbi:4-alpha-glucanotransferase [Candidatus Sulfotelmatobacter kueseliae]|uniref:4-alpha-glucanotransferase n=1 Tax=Candidatus Sulfotelmatobacter kueseliae TaxID=2042962 RepID=A0A2U3L9M5_9BACT|nr:4-alpha-glucanotransferase [Candidatus Sulfotelmatobacter kueseliae]